MLPSGDVYREPVVELSDARAAVKVACDVVMFPAEGVVVSINTGCDVIVEIPGSAVVRVVPSVIWDVVSIVKVVLWCSSF